MLKRTTQRAMRSLLVLPCLLGILAFSPLFAQSPLGADAAAHTIIADGTIPQMPGPNK
jgi:hypothetical protein